MSGDMEQTAMEKRERIQLIDAVRGLAILLVVIYHFHVDMYLLGIIGGSRLYSPLVDGLQTFFASLFILASGICCRFSRNNLKRGLLMFGAGIAVSIVTYIYNPDAYVRFGILHFLGTAAVFYALAGKALDKLLPSFLWPVLCAAGFVFGLYLSSRRFHVPHLWMFGIRQTGFRSTDYFPLFPHLFTYLFGAWMGKYIAAGRFPAWFYRFRCAPLAAIGRHTMWIYLAHQPVLMGILWLWQRPAA